MMEENSSSGTSDSYYRIVDVAGSSDQNSIAKDAATTSLDANQEPFALPISLSLADSVADSKVVKRISVTLAPDTVNRLKKLASDKGITFTEALRRAVGTEVYLQNEIQKGGKVLIQKSDNTLREVTFR